jgi:hypothetical protein
MRERTFTPHPRNLPYHHASTATTATPAKTTGIHGELANTAGTMERCIPRISPANVLTMILLITAAGYDSEIGLLIDEPDFSDVPV